MLGLGLGGDQSTLKPESKASADIAGLWWIMLIGSVVVFAVVLALLLVGVLRRRGGDTGRWSTLGTPFVAIAGVAIPTVTLVVLFALTLATIPATSATGGTSSGSSPLVIDVTGRQWFWDVATRRRASAPRTRSTFPSAARARSGRRRRT